MGSSRREADNLIQTGKVRINTIPADLGGRVYATDIVTVNGKPLVSNVSLHYIVFHKPVGYVCSRKDQGETPTIYAILPKEYHSYKPVGRLDKNSSGILLLTNDGDFAFKMTHPKFQKIKIYEIILDHELEPFHQQLISDHGIELEDGRSQLHLERISDTNRLHWRVTMHEGKNRQIRRTFGSLGYEVVSLHRTNFGPYNLQGLDTGAYKEIQP